MSYCLVTGSGGLVGSETVKFFCNIGYNVIGIDNDMRNYFFNTSTKNITNELKTRFKNFTHCNIDIRNKDSLKQLFKKHGENIKCIVHCAAQPSHDWAAKEPHTDFGINAVGTLNLLELTRTFCMKASFIFMSTNKVYGDNPNRLDIKELETRYEIADELSSIDETMSVDQCKHSIFGASKLAADIMVQEYGQYFGMNTVVFRGGCITGPNHQGAELHGFLSYIVKCIITNQPYKIFGYKGKQVRDNIHSYDLVNAFWNYHKNPKPGAVYNIGGGRNNSLSILETIKLVNNMINKSWSNYEFIDEARSGDHIWYISDLSKFKNDYPEWDITYSIERIIRDIICSISPNIVTAQLQGGIGNQMFQIAIAYATAKRLNYNLKFKNNQFSGCRQGSHPSTYYDNIFQKINFTNIPTCDCVINEQSWAAYSIMKQVKHIMRGSEKKCICFKGYYQSDNNWQEYAQEIKQLFTPEGGIVEYLNNNSEIFKTFPELAKDNDHVFMGIRRGDYITYPDTHNPCGMTYYNKAINIMNKPNVTYYIITDDWGWAKTKFQGKNYKFLEIKADKIMLLTMALFKNYIISNSTFYWWGSFLSIYKNPKIIAPDKWLLKNSKKEQYWSIYRKEMNVIERPVEIN